MQGSQHITVTRSTFSWGATASPVDAVDIDGASSHVSLTDTAFDSSSTGDAVKVASGASFVTIASCAVTNSATGGGVTADGTTGLILAGDSVQTRGGVGITVSGTSTGSIENTVFSSPDNGTRISVSSDSADYNVVSLSDASHPAYVWGSTAYTSVAAFAAGTGQGRHDASGASATPVPSEGSGLIDSGDADAPGETPTDIHGNPRVDDSLVPNTGTGTGTVDRGAYEFQNPLHLAIPGADSRQGPTPLRVTATTYVTNPWSTTGIAYTFDFGDGSTPVTSSKPTATHTYTQVGPQGGYPLTVTATLPDGTERTAPGSGHVQVNAPGPLTASLKLTGSTRLTADLKAQAASPWGILDMMVVFGDGSQPAEGDSDMSLVHTYPAPGTYTATLYVTDEAQQKLTITHQLTVGSTLVPVTPIRVLDTRVGTGAPKAKVGPGSVLRLKIAGANGIPTAGVAAVTMNVTGTNPTSADWVVAYPDGSPRPQSSDLNVKSGETDPNLVTVPVGADGYVDLYNASGRIDLIADVQGYYSTSPSTQSGQGTDGGLFTPVVPTRILDTRNGTGAPEQPAGPGSTTVVALPAGTVPLDATAVIVNVTAASPTTDGFITAYPGAGALPNVSDLNLKAGQTTSNAVVLPVDSSRSIRLFNRLGRTALIADVQGYFSSSPAGAAYVPTAPTRLVDTRVGSRHLGAGADLRIKVTGVQGVPAGIGAVTVNLTGTGSTRATYLTAFGSGSLPIASNLDLTPGQTRPALVTVPVNSNGYITVHNAYGTVDVIADLEGYYAVGR